MEPAKDISKGSVALGGRNTQSAQLNFAEFPTLSAMPTSIGDGRDWPQEQAAPLSAPDAGCAIRIGPMLDTLTQQLALVGTFALVGALICLGASYGAAESKRLARVHQEDSVHVARR